MKADVDAASAHFVLEDVTVPIPCHVPWDSMNGDDRKRFCGECKLHVFNVAELSRREAENLIRDSGGDLCVRMFRRPDGTVVTKACVDILAAARRRTRIAIAAVLGVFGLAASAFAGWVTSLGGLNSHTAWDRQPLATIEAVVPEQWVPQAPVIQGRICMPVPPPKNNGVTTPSNDCDPTGSGDTGVPIHAGDE